MAGHALADCILIKMFTCMYAVPLLQEHQLPEAWRVLWGVQLPAGRGAQR
jgi:hypothetical protein